MNENAGDSMSAEAVLVFDENHTFFIHSLMRLNGKCLTLHDEKVTFALLNMNGVSGTEATFFRHMSDAINCMIVYLFNEEISNMCDRGAIREILGNAVDGHLASDIEDREKLYLYRAEQNVREVFVEQMNAMTGSYFVDFTVSTYSVFEKWMSKLFLLAKNMSPSKGTKKKKLIKLIDAYQECADDRARDQLLEEIMSKCSSYISGAEKINTVFSAGKKAYSRDIENDMNLVQFYAARRNTIHNFGVHERASLKPFMVKGVEMTLEKGRGTYTEDFRAIVNCCEELVDIYSATLHAFQVTDANLILE